MSTATILIKTKKILDNDYSEMKHEDNFVYYKIELPENFNPYLMPKENREKYRICIQNLYKSLTRESYVMAKFDSIEKYFDQ